MGKDIDRNLRCSLAFAAASADAIAVNGWDATTTDKLEGVETVIGPGWLAYIEADPRIRGKEAVQRVPAFHTMPSPDKEFHRCGTHSPHPPVANSTVTSSFSRS